MEENRDQILLDFQSCTGVEDVAECIMYLEATNWNLLDAINNVMPQETQTLPSESMGDEVIPIMDGIEAAYVPDIQLDPPSGSNTALTSIGNVRKAACSTSSSFSQPSGSSTFVSDSAPALTPNLFSLKNHGFLKFTVKYKDRLVPLEVPENETIASLKNALFTELGVPPCRQELKGFQRNHITDETVLSTLGLTPKTHLNLSVPKETASVSDDEQMDFASSLNMMYGLFITDETNHREFNIKFPGTKSVREVKQDIYAVTDIPVRHQRWTGWPELAEDENMLLAAIHLNYPSHNLKLRDESARLGTSSRKYPIVDISGSSGEEFEDAPDCFVVDDDLFPRETASKRTQPLMPDNTTDEASAIEHFCREFQNRYGECHPAFFQGTLSEALQASCQKPAKDRKPLLVYLHHDASVLTNVFCTQLLCSETIVTFLALNFLSWAWDLTFESNKSRFLGNVTQHLGIAASATIRSIAVDNLPALMVISRVRSTTEVITVIPGNVSLDELMTRLLHAVEVFNSGLTTEIREEDEREARESVKREQDAAYAASLEADKLKEQTKQQEKELQEMRESAEKAQKEQEEQAKQHKEALKEAIRLSLVEQLPTEPLENSAKPITRIRIRLPSGEMLVRRFLATDSLQILLLYLASQGFPKTDYKVLGSWPRRDLSALDPEKTFQELSLCPQEMVTLEER